MMCVALFVYVYDSSSLTNNCVPLRLSCVPDDNNDCVRKEHHKRRMYDDGGAHVGITVPVVTIY